MKYSESLKKQQDFSKVYKKGRSRANPYLVLYSLPNGTDRNRLGISVSRKVGNSVVRHRITRLVRESYRTNEESICRGYDLVVIARARAKGAPYTEIRSALFHLMNISGLLSQSGYGENEQ